jgi:hypothetical protein
MSAVETSVEEKVLTVAIGAGPKDADGFRKSMRDKGIHIGRYADDALNNPAFIVATKETKLKLVIRSVLELGFKKGANLEQIYARAKQLGLDICPAEVGPQLRLQYIYQPGDEWLVIAMEPIIEKDGRPGVFAVINNTNNPKRIMGLGLYMLCVFNSEDGKDDKWGPNDHFAFRRAS